MKKVHITPKNKSFDGQRPFCEVPLVRAISLGAVMAALLSGVSPVFASHLSSTGSKVQSVSAGVVSTSVAHGRVEVANGDRSCRVDQVVSRSSSGSGKKVSAKEQYKKLAKNQQFMNCNPNDSVSRPVTWVANTDVMFSAVATDVNMRQSTATPESIQGYFDSFTSRGIGTELGLNANAQTGEDTAIGREARAEGGGATVLGVASQALQANSTAVGSFSAANGKKSIAIGAFATAKLGTAVGYNAQSFVEGGIALGDDSKASIDKEIAGYDPGSGISSVETSFIWKSTYAAVSVGDVSGGKTRQIVGVAAGYNDTDAVNVAQLKALKTWVEEEGGTWQLSVNGQNTTKINKNSNLDLVAESNNIKIAKNDDKITFDLADTLVLKSVSTGKVNLRGDGLFITNGPAVTVAGINAANKHIIDVADGDLFSGSKEAVNAGQVYTLNSNVAQYLGGEANVLENMAPTYTIQSQDHDNVGDAFKGVDETLTRLSGEIDSVADVINNGLVQQDFLSKQITIGDKVEGNEISIANNSKAPRKLTGLEKGNVSEHSTEAVNGAQLYEVQKNITTLHGTVLEIKGNVTTLDTNINEYLGGGANILENKEPTYSIQNQKHNDIASAFEGVDGKLTELSKQFESMGNNGLVVQEEDTHTITIGAKVDGDEISIANKDKAARTLSGVKAGTITADSIEAINGAQLYETNTTIAKYFGGGAEYNGQWQEPTFIITSFDAQGKSGEQQYHNVADAFGAVNSSMSGLNDRIEQIEQQTGSPANSNSLNWNNDKNAYDASHNNQPGKITNVANGAVAQGSTDVVTGDQLWATNDKIDNLEGKVDSIITNGGGALIDGAVTYDKDADGNKMNSITLVGTGDDTPVIIDNVADGKIEKGSKQVVNGGQLHDYIEEQMSLTLAEANKYTDEKIDNIVGDAVAQANAYTDTKFDALNYKIESVQKEARQAAAIGLAVANLRYNDTPGKLSVAFGSGIWRSQSAPAFGAGYTSEDGNTRSNLSLTTSGGRLGVGAGISFTLN
ncbi:YadA-like family protein [Bartonella bovis]|uniref:Surface protein/Bartonella adhesin n=1 Tax=Bartonella bovis m02 TaxID=1094492 RepID=N6VQB2_9HYPH|nr:YadA-like family protein [Bartonella bovis]ENN93262.1 surface protein/Bartonella adhesin [Bartonella bovis m02]